MANRSAVFVKTENSEWRPGERYFDLSNVFYVAPIHAVPFMNMW